MEQEQAQQLTQRIKSQFPHVEAGAFLSSVRPNTWIVEVRKREVPPESQALLIFSENEWQDALTALTILSK